MNKKETIFVDIGMEEILDLPEEEQADFFWQTSFQWIKDKALKEIKKMGNSFSTESGWEYWFLVKAAERTGLLEEECERILTEHSRYEEFVGYCRFERAHFILKVAKFIERVNPFTKKAKDIKMNFDYEHYNLIMVYIWSTLRSDDSVNSMMFQQDYWTGNTEKFITKCVVTYLIMSEEWKRSGKQFEEQFADMWDDLE